MSEQPEPKPDLPTDSEKFENALRTILTTPKKDVDAKMAAEREHRKQEASQKQK